MERIVICPISMAGGSVKECDPRCAMNENGECALWRACHDISILENKVHTSIYGAIMTKEERRDW